MADSKVATNGSETAVAGNELLRGVEASVAVGLMRDMLLFRRFEAKAEEAYAIGKIGGFCHLHVGQEGVAAGCIKPLRKDDYAISGYRDHTQAIAKGVKPKAVMAELFGRADGCSGGKGGSMHLFGPDVGFMGGHGIVGGQIPLATGMAFAAKYRPRQERAANASHCVRATHPRGRQIREPIPPSSSAEMAILGQIARRLSLMEEKLDLLVRKGKR